VEVKDPKEKEYYGSDIAFIGTWDKEREWWLSHLINYNLKIWGNDWNRANKKLQEKWMKKPVYAEEFAKVCNSSKIILNIIRKQDYSSHNMKTFEIPAYKGFLLSNFSEEANEFFPENIAAVYYSDVDDLKNKINYFLQNEKEREKIIENAYNLLINNNHTYEDRVKSILKIVGG
jgi:spore maturation protein CgeB